MDTFVVFPWAVMLFICYLPAMVISTHSAADYYVHNLPGIPEDVPLIKMHAGHVEIDPEHNGNMFFWHFQNQHIADRQRTVIWLNGGPGCSSEDGALMEIGPYRLKDEQTLKLNDGSWNEFANLLFVDNPLGTGFSSVDPDSYTRTLPLMASQFVTFLENFFSVFPEYEQHDIFLAGESYAGQYIPYIAKAVLERNKARKQTSFAPWNLRGLLIGNGWMSPKDQYESYLTFTVEKGLVQKGTEESDKLQSLLHGCQQAMGRSPTLAEYPNCGKVRAMMKDIGRDGDGDKMCYNIFDIRLKDSYPSCGMNWPPDLKLATPYLRRPEVISQLNIQNQSGSGWQECKASVGRALRPSDDEPSVRLLPELLEKIPIVLFSGAEDLSCNHIGTENMIHNLEWNGATGFGARRRYWTFDGEPAGFWQEARNLTYVLFYSASHMVPLDYPRRSLDMLNRFMGVKMGTLTDSRIEGGDDVSEGASSSYAGESHAKLATPYPFMLFGGGVAGEAAGNRGATTKSEGE